MRPKRKTTSHIIEKKSLQIINDTLPNYWTIREYKPDYGIDLSIELFEKIDSNGTQIYDTLGEHLLVQVKGTETVEKTTIKVRSRKNIENIPLDEGEDVEEMKVVKFQIDTNELFTIHRMGNTIPVLLFVIDIGTKDIFFVCLNDYIDKVILPTEPEFFTKTQKNKIIYIPIENLISLDPKSLLPIYFYSKRPKFYSFFNKIGYQTNELKYCDNDIINERCKYYISILLRFDVWDNNFWPIINYYKQLLIQLNNTNESPMTFVKSSMSNEIEKEWEYGESGKLYTRKEILNLMWIQSLWQQMDSIKNTYEELCREWFLPLYSNTFLLDR